MNINKNKYITVIAEIGINHNGDINLAKKLMLLASYSTYLSSATLDLKAVPTLDMVMFSMNRRWGTMAILTNKGWPRIDKSLLSYAALLEICT